MSDLYEKCVACDGRGFTRFSAEPCRSCEGRRFIPVGLTTGQVDAIVARERVRVGDPGAAPVVTIRFRTVADRDRFVGVIRFVAGPDLRTLLPSDAEVLED